MEPSFTKTRKAILLPFFFFFLSIWGHTVQASHIRAGQIYYKSDTTAAPNPLRFFFTLVTYSVTPPPFEDLEATLHFGDCTSQKVARESSTRVSDGQNSWLVNVYQFEHTYNGPGTYTASYSVGSQGGIVNISSGTKPDFLLQSTLTVDRLLSLNRSPVYKFLPAGTSAQNRVFTLPSGATDPDGDSLSFKLVPPQTPNGVTSCENPVGMATPGYSGLENFLGIPDPSTPSGVTLNRNTGLLTWNTPSQQGLYNLAVLVEEWRNGRLIGTVTRDMLLSVLEPTLTALPDDLIRQISFYPNPAAGVFTIKTPPALLLRAARVSNLLGHVVTLPLPRKTTHGWALDVHSLADGVYILSLLTDQGTINQRFVVKH